jgi:hypothetical protein
MSGMGDKPKSAYELAMERLGASDRESGVEETLLTGSQKEAIAEARRVATSRLAEREILYRDAMRRRVDPEEREKAAEEYQIDRQRIEADRDRAIEAIRRGTR